MVIEIARRAVEPAEKVLTNSFRFAGWVVGRAAAPLVIGARIGTRIGVRVAGRPAVDTLSRISPAAAEALWALLPGTRPTDRPRRPVIVPAGTKPAGTKPAATPAPRVATIPTAPGGPSPAEAHATAGAMLAEVDATSIDAGDLPIGGWDGLTVAAIRQRTRALKEHDLVTLLAYERAHANRPAVILNVENRLAKVHQKPVMPGE